MAVTLSRPRSADWVAETAHVAGNTARDHLQRLVGMNVLHEVPGDGATRYRPDPLYTRMRALREQAARAETARETRDLRRTASDWDVVRYRLRLVEDAIEHYSDYTGTTPTPA